MSFELLSISLVVVSLLPTRIQGGSGSGSSQILHAVSDVPTSLPLLLVLSLCKCVSVACVCPSACVPAPPWALWDAGSPACVWCLIRLVRLSLDSLDPFSPSVPMNRHTCGLIIVQLESARTLLYTKAGGKKCLLHQKALKENQWT